MKNNKVGELVKAAVDAEGARLAEQYRDGLLTADEVKVALEAFGRGSHAVLGIVAKALAS
jgi:hypothetical protein